MTSAAEICKTAPKLLHKVMPPHQPTSPYESKMHNAQQVNCLCLYTICL